MSLKSMDILSATDPMVFLHTAHSKLKDLGLYLHQKADTYSDHDFLKLDYNLLPYVMNLRKKDFE